MSANIYWQAVVPLKGEDVGTMAPSSFIEDVKRVFGDFPVVLSEADLPKLEAVSMLKDSDNDYSHPWRDLIEAIQKVGKIRVWAEW